MLCKPRGRRSHEQYMIRVFHDQAGRRNRVHDPFDRGDGSGFEVHPFHDRGVHPLHSVQLTIRSSSCIEQSRLFQETDRAFNGDQRRTSPRENGVGSRERISQASGLQRRQASKTGASVDKNERTGIGQLRRRSRACRYAGSFMRSRSDRTNPRPVTQSSKLSESFRNRGGSSCDGPSAICATIP
jgi:hypothetical protein